MTTPKNDGGPAFPSLSHTPAHGVAIEGKPESLVRYPERFTSTGGMTLRDYFAGQIIGACIAANISKGGRITMKQCAKDAYQQADAMIEARTK